MRRECFSSSSAPSDWTLVGSYETVGTSTVSLSLPNNSLLGFWIVGGGGGGKGDFSNSDNPGNGGNGGQAMSFTTTYSSSYTTCSVTVGAGGTGGPKKSSTAGGTGGASSVTFGGNTYTANGGYGGVGTTNTAQTVQSYSGLGGRMVSGNSTAQAQARTQGKAGEGESFTESGTTRPNTWYANGGDGQLNPFDATDTVKYGAGGGGGNDAYRSGPNSYYAMGGETGGGRGGYGGNNASTNGGSNGVANTGSGGGGGSFSSNHTYGYGGDGGSGIVKIYYKQS